MDILSIMLFLKDINSIAEEITDKNFFALYANAYAFGCDKLQLELGDLAIKKLLKDTTASKMYLDAVEHNDKKIM